MSLKKEYEENGLLCLKNIISIDLIDKINFKIETFKRENQKKVGASFPTWVAKRTKRENTGRACQRQHRNSLKARTRNQKKKWNVVRRAGSSPSGSNGLRRIGYGAYEYRPRGAAPSRRQQIALW